MMAPHSASRMRRRAALGALGGGSASLALAPGRVAASQRAGPIAQASPRLRIFGPADTPFHQTGRRALADDVLRWLPDLHGLHPGRTFFLLPPTPVIGTGNVAHPRPWQLTVPGGVPIYLAAFLSVDASADPELTRVSVDGQPVIGAAGTSTPAAGSASSAGSAGSATPVSLDAYRHGGVRATIGLNLFDHTVCDLVIAPPPPGRYTIEVRRDDPKDERRRFTLVYEITIQDTDALGPLVLQEPAASGPISGVSSGVDAASRQEPASVEMVPTLWALQGNRRRRLPDLESAAALGYRPEAIKDASPAALALFQEGEALPPLREGMLVKGPAAPLFRLSGGRRVRLRSLEEAGTDPVVQGVDGAVLHTIPAELPHDTLLQSGGDIYHADNGALRHVPNWEWLTSRTFRGEDMTRLPERLLVLTPRTRPHGLPAGVIWMDAPVRSEALGVTLPYRVFLPPGYFTAEHRDRRYPVVYLLHGMSGRWDEWHILIELERMLNQVVTADPATHLIVMLPQGGFDYWVNQRGGARWTDYVVKDVVPHADGTYRTLPERASRAIGGLSMGGHGAVQIAINFPDLFGAVGAHSPSLPEADRAPGYFGGPGAYSEYDPQTLVKHARLSRPPLFWIDVGEEDRWAKRAEQLRDAIRERGWDHEWRLNRGGHDREYWNGQLKEYLGFYLSTFARNGGASRRV